MKHTLELWRPVPGFELRYSVSSAGRIRSELPSRKGRIRKQMFDWNGFYPAVALLDSDGKLATKRVHRIVLEAFEGLDPMRPCCNHKNGDKMDNRIENLEWCTKAENNRHAYAVLKRKPPVRVLSDSAVKEIREAYQTKTIAQRTLAVQFGVHQSIISRVVRHKSYRY